MDKQARWWFRMTLKVIAWAVVQVEWVAVKERWWHCGRNWKFIRLQWLLIRLGLTSTLIVIDKLISGIICTGHTTIQTYCQYLIKERAQWQWHAHMSLVAIHNLHYDHHIQYAGFKIKQLSQNVWELAMTVPTQVCHSSVSRLGPLRLRQGLILHLDELRECGTDDLQVSKCSQKHAARCTQSA